MMNYRLVVLSQQLLLVVVVVELMLNVLRCHLTH